jgi:hypothetical protein
MPQLVINKVEWESFLGETLDSTYLLTGLVTADKGRAIFRAEAPQARTQALVWVADAEGVNAEALRRRYLEASYLRHENILSVIRVARTESHGRDLVYAAQENADETLQQAAERAPLSVEEIRKVTAEVARALSYLHSENLVYCALSCSTIWRVGERWKLGDFTQLRLPGRTDANETRALLTRHPNAPPEAFEGMVSPAWDVWSLGWMIGKLAGRDHAFDRIVAGCVKPNPEDRWTLEQVMQALEERTVDEPAQEEHEAPAAAEPPASPLREKPWLRTVVVLLIAGLVACCIGLVIKSLPDRHPTIPGKRVQPPGAAQVPRAATPGARSPVVAAASRVAAANAVTSDGIHQLLDRWVDSTRKKDANEQAACYAPVVDQFYGWQKVSSDRILREKQRQFSQIGKVRRFDISNVRVNQNGPDKATVSLDKTWDFGEEGRFAGSEKAQLNVAKLNGKWRITSEREMKVYWVKR